MVPAHATTPGSDTGPETRAALRDPQADPRATLRALAGRAGTDGPNSVLLLGGFGAGKTALLEAAAETARSAGTRLVWVRGEQVGHEFAPLRRVLDQLADVLATLPEPHRAALRSAASDRADPPAPEILLATAMLTLLRTAAVVQPVLIIVDDAQWLNAGTARRLAFVARRLAGSRARLLIAATSNAASISEQAVDLVLEVRPETITPSHQDPGAVTGPGDSARLLEDFAASARDRGEVDSAASGLRLAAVLSEDPEQRARRYATAACMLIATSGDLTQVQRSMADARRAQALVPGAADSLEFVTVDCYLGINDPGPLDVLRHRLVTCLLDRHEAASDWVVEDAGWVLYNFCWYLNRPDVWAEFAAVTDQLAARLPAWLRLAGPLMNGADISHPGLAAEADLLLESLQHERRPWTVIRNAQVTRFRDHRFGWRRALRRVWAERSAEGAVISAEYAAAVLSDDLTGAGDWDSVREMTGAALATCADLGYWSFPEGFLLYMSARVAAHRGDARLLCQHTERLLTWAAARGARDLTIRALHCRACAALADGDPVRAHRQLASIEDPGGYSAPLIVGPWMAIDFADAAVGASAWPDVDELLARVEAIGASGGWRALQFTGAFAIAVTGRPGTELDSPYQRALAIPGADQWPFDLARIRLSYGERLRAAGRDEDARAQLRLAAGTFRHLDARPWLARAADQISALGDIHERMPTRKALTAMERRVAELAASGLTNREIAARLRTSAGTVNSQLSRAYTKLGVRSRAALRDALPRAPTSTRHRAG